MAFEALQAIVDGMVPGSWARIPNTNGEQAGSSGRNGLYTKVEVDAIQRQGELDHGIAERINIWGNAGSKSVFTAEAGAAWDGQRMYFHTGGHYDYGGNEIYAFNFGHSTDLSLGWERVIPPSPLVLPYPNLNGDVPDTCKLPEHGPSANHTWDHFEYFPPNNSLMQLGSDRTGYCRDYYYPSTGRQIMWEFMLGSKTWVPHPITQTVKTGHCMSAYYPVREEMILYNKAGWGDGIWGPWAYDKDGEMTRRGDVRAYDNSPTSMEYNPNDGLLYFSQNDGTIRTIDPAETPLKRAGKIVGTVPQELLDQSPNTAYAWYEGSFVLNPANNTILLWMGNHSVWVFNITNSTFIEFKNLDSPIFPESQDKHIYGKFRYIKEVNAYVGGTKGDEDFWVYRLDNYSGGITNRNISMRGKINGSIQMGVKGAINAPATPSAPVVASNYFTVTGSTNNIPTPGLLENAVVFGTISSVDVVQPPNAIINNIETDGRFTINTTEALPQTVEFDFTATDEYGVSNVARATVVVNEEVWQPIKNIYIKGVVVDKVILHD